MKDLIMALLASLVIFLLWYVNNLRAELFRWVRNLQENDRMLLGHIGEHQRSLEKIVEVMSKMFPEEPAEECTNDGGDDTAPEV